MSAADPITGQIRGQLAELAHRFPDRFIEGKDGQPYVAHHVINQRLLSVVGPFDFELAEIIRGDVPAVAPDPSGKSRRAKAGTPALHNAVVGGIWRLTCEIDGQRTSVEEVGDVGDVHNWPHDGARLKDAASDALKRCAMRLGLGLHLWAQEHYFLDQQLATEPAPVENQESKPDGASQPAEGKPQEGPSDAGQKAPDPTPGPGEADTPPGFDHLTSPALARAWVMGQGAAVRDPILQDAAAAGITLAEAPLADLRRLILAAWSSQKDAAA